ncbi:DUF2283 domain-containing protein [Candidatus Methanodesulfokora washburnensis]|jgi:uncharacterized protein YuzE|uniref:DUF2283 domain-containing protein n=1 Tax=Candidatus Methanodesulfokora washburnensis TaxID=2478471 RepID=A0A429GLC3_9CREN|nr:DUF2283 domain-containing protein [Candidatus Methanodesulfokores washburnensis]RSN74577.1 DUF2283 domain-containing protein [Candidatus Methanodesulfokores washburnensis]
MRVRYSRDEDILIIELSDDKIDHAEEMESIIVHFTENNRLVMLEILDASRFIAEISSAMRAGGEFVEVQM